jgi:hypothetical protein
MKLILSLLASMLLFSLSQPDASTAADAKVFTNADLCKENGKEGVSNRKTGRVGASRARVNTQSEKEKDRWCRKGNLHRNRVGAAQANLSEAERKYSDSLEKASASTPKKRKRAAKVSDSGVRKARLKLEKAERALNDLEQEAHRKNIPPGWLRCQFSY